MTLKQKTGGRKIGTENKVHSDIKKAFNTLLAVNMDNLNTWLNKTAEENPAKALELVIKISEFILPKLKTIDLEANKDSIVNIKPKEWIGNDDYKYDLKKLTVEELREYAKIQAKLESN